jgi:DNA modification methylase
MTGTSGLVGHLAIGDNLHVLREFIDDESIDLIYLDPPFNSNRAYSLIFRDPTRGHSEAQAVAFKDQWTWNAGTEARFRDLLIPSVGSRATTRLSMLLANQVSAFERTQMAAYLVEMAVRLVELHRVLKSTGSLYLHCDPTASHYLKVVLDAIFGPTNFRNEVIWRRTRAHNDRNLRHFGASHDVLLLYTKSDRWTFHRMVTARDPAARKAHDLYRHTDGKLYRKGDCRAPGGRGPRYEWNGHWGNWRFTEAAARELEARGMIVYTRTGMPRVLRVVDLTRGSPLQDIWVDIDRQNSGSKEELPYPTQKPVDLLRRIIEVSSNPDDLILDPFCGCGTAIEAARDLGRRWIGIDISVRALDVIKERFAGGDHVPFRVLAPADEEAARRLAEAKPNGRREFEAWALTLIGARKNVDRDRGVDGLIPFIGARGRIQQALVSVKSGHTSPSEVRDLVGAVHRERSPAGIFLTLDEPTKEMKLEAARAVPLIPGIPRIQIITIRDALREDHPARPLLPAYRQDELFEAVPEVSNDVAALEDEVRELIVQVRAAKVSERREVRARLLDSIQQVLDKEPGQEIGRAANVPARAGQRPSRTDAARRS